MESFLADGFPILVVDDQPSICAEVSQYLKSGGFRVESVASGPEAFERFNTTKFSLVIADEKVEGIDGQNLLISLKKASPQIPVIIMTANGSVHNAVKAMLAGAADYLLKPFSSESLEKTVKRTVGGANGNGGCLSVGRLAVLPGAGKEIITRNQTMLDILKQVRAVAPSSATVLILGESGTGKELLAAYVHRHSGHPEAPYVALNCAALPDTLAESELFGHEKGSFTGAVGRKIGKFEQANKGTVVLDEISEMPPPLQAKLLRVLQEKVVDRIGGTRPVPIEARVVAISNEGRMLVFPASQLPALSRGKGNKIIGIPAKRVEAREEFVVAVSCVPRGGTLTAYSGKRHINLKARDLDSYEGERGRRGNKLPRGFQKVDTVAVEG